MLLNFNKLILSVLGCHLVITSLYAAESAVEDVAALAGAVPRVSEVVMPSGAACARGDVFDEQLERILSGGASQELKDQLKEALRRDTGRDPALFVTQVIKIFEPLTLLDIQRLNPDEITQMVEMVSSIPPARRAQFVDLFARQGRLFCPTNPFFKGDTYSIIAKLREIAATDSSDWATALTLIKTPKALGNPPAPSVPKKKRSRGRRR